jgi:hypothetical protein
MLLQKSAALNELREQNKVLAHEKWILGQEKAQLSVIWAIKTIGVFHLEKVL